VAKNITKLKHRFPILSLWPIIVLLFVCLFLAFANYQPGTWLIGWDNLVPEFNFRLDIKRSLFSVWQEYRGLGLLGGMAHAADLSRELLLYLLSAIGRIPSANIRYLWTFFTLALGPISVYLLLNKIILKTKSDPKTVRFASFLGGLFYLLNLATVQYFYTPFETFHSFFGFFPLLIFIIIRYLEKPKIVNFLILTTVLIFSSSAFYVQTLFIVLILCLLPITLEYLSTHRFHKKSILTSFYFLLSTFFTQAYWLIPAVFFAATNAGVAGSAHINLVSSPETAARNLEFATLKDLAFLKGYWFNYVDLALDQKYDYLLLPWRNHLNQPVIAILGVIAFALVLTGIYYSLKKKLHYGKAFLSFLLISGFFLLGGGQLIGRFIPLIGELFRSPFTKFSVALSFTYSIFFAVGCIFLLDLFSFLHSRLTYYLTLFTVSLALVIYMTPAFTGNLISPTMRLKIPQEYFQTFEFFKGEDPATRIANFPQYTFWGWNYYSWGYRGSGFLWYGIKQPILDRAFDVWEKSSQKYYEEISTALYNQDRQEFERLIDKYAINWILLDRNIIAPGAETDLGNQKLLDIINSSNKFTLAENFDDKILIYKTDVDKNIKNFLSVGARRDAPQGPFAELPLRPFSPKINDDSITLENLISQSLDIPSYTDSESLVPTAISYRKTGSGIEL